MRRAFPVLVALAVACGGSPKRAAEPDDEVAIGTEAREPDEAEPEVDGEPPDAPEEAEPVAPTAKRALLGEGSVRGVVTGVSDGRPMSGVTVMLRLAGGKLVTTTTNRRGEYRLPPVPAGTVSITFSYRKVDFTKEIEIEAATETVLSVTLNARPEAPVIIK